VSFLVVNELILETVPYRAGRWMSCHGDLDQVGGDSAVSPGAHGAIHVAPVGVGGDRWRDINDDMIGELVLAEVVEEESLLPIIVW
jgi:hypothetical protein